MFKNLLKLFKFGLLLVFLAVVAILLSELIISFSVANNLYSSIDELPPNKVGLLLGTCKYVVGGAPNIYYDNRLRGALELFEKGKIDYILVSGDNATKYYNETRTIREDLIRLGIPKENIFSDYAGFRTLDSVIRSQAIFGQTNITVISQKFHNQRAIFIAKAKGIKAIGFNVKGVNFEYDPWTFFRERLARIKMMFDLIIGIEPKFYGKKIEIK